MTPGANRRRHDIEDNVANSNVKEPGFSVRHYLAQRGIAFREHDIDTPDGQLAFAQAGNASGIPLLLLGEQRVQGFSAAAYDALLAPLKPSARHR